MIALLLALTAFQASPSADAASAATDRAEARRIVDQAAAEAARQPWDDAPIVEETDAQALCRQARKMQEQLAAIADRETTARVLLARYSKANGAPPDLTQVESLLADQDDLALGYMVADWSINRACKAD